VTVKFDVTEQTRTLTGESLGALRLGYAQHIHRAQGATVTRTLIVTGGWQTSKEPAYVEASRAREGTDWFIAREDLGLEGMDSDRVERLAAKMSRSTAQVPSLEHPEVADAAYGPEIDLSIPPSRTRLPALARLVERVARSPATQERPR
jgi:hypothetical protein